MDYDTYPEVIYFKSFEELITFRTLCASQFPQLRTVTVYHLYTSGEAYLEDYGLLEDADDEEEE
jgi:hypothetical protein